MPKHPALDNESQQRAGGQGHNPPEGSVAGEAVGPQMNPKKGPPNHPSQWADHSNKEPDPGSPKQPQGSRSASPAPGTPPSPKSTCSPGPTRRSAPPPDPNPRRPTGNGGTNPGNEAPRPLPPDRPPGPEGPRSQTNRAQMTTRNWDQQSTHPRAIQNPKTQSPSLQPARNPKRLPKHSKHVPAESAHLAADSAKRDQERASATIKGPASQPSTAPNRHQGYPPSPIPEEILYPPYHLDNSHNI
ncbi:basic salivary proline-rich protein 4-like [Austrofundulus limnaeus]|uniref:Basic salivary proline-rich protein 4-like n=1 Tax=Austrofundulus limnaeus TaxID=52670 RepID=A0A2I4BMF9_AUSLI|nr:PREDICTED: basic salivary proline-rich protein 4-like [Austrofundulus limnaeus]